ncbi:MAG TPA: MBL fold metallo-hydrolase [Solirubrobacteraceae bacterium]|nr:MBL fold metallo-hydrolase [Solirubrobacteraceae bacterium]
MASTAIRPIDVRQLEHEGVICCYLVGDVLIDCGPAARVGTLLEQLGSTRPRVLALTHIHLDHAGAAGTLAALWPELEVWVHERGAPHLVDPSRLLASATRLYGDDMERLWGEVRAVPQTNVRALQGGEALEGLEVAYTPGHASHHVSYWHPQTRTAFVGDVAGVRAAGSDYVLAPTPPPDIDLEAWAQSLERVREWRPRELAITHFGSFEAGAQLDAIERALEVAGRRSRELSEQEFMAAVAADIDADERARDAAVYLLGAPLDQLYGGLARYWSKREAPR